jgi:hypothetical protein
MLQLLLSKSIYTDVKNDYCVQLTGHSLADLAPLRPRFTESGENATAEPDLPSNPKGNSKRKWHTRADHPPKKRQKCSSTEVPILPRTPNAIVFPRSRIFYTRPAKSLRGQVVFGLRKERKFPNELNRLTLRCSQSMFGS